MAQFPDKHFVQTTIMREIQRTNDENHEKNVTSIKALQKRCQALETENAKFEEQLAQQGIDLDNLKQQVSALGSQISS